MWVLVDAHGGGPYTTVSHEMTGVSINPPAEPDEAAAIMAAIAQLMNEEPSEPVRMSVWSLAGRLEAQGLPVTREKLSADWSRHLDV